MSPGIAIAGFPGDASLAGVDGSFFIHVYAMEGYETSDVTRVDLDSSPLNITDRSYVYSAATGTHSYFFTLKVGDGPFPIKASSLTKMMWAKGQSGSSAMVLHTSW